MPLMQMRGMIKKKKMKVSLEIRDSISYMQKMPECLKHFGNHRK